MSASALSGTGGPACRLRRGGLHGLLSAAGAAVLGALLLRAVRPGAITVPTAPPVAPGSATGTARPSTA